MNIKAQEVPIEFYEYKTQNFYFDMGKNWDYITTLGSLRYENIDLQNSIDKVKSLNFRTKIGLNIDKDYMSVYSFYVQQKEIFILIYILELQIMMHLYQGSLEKKEIFQDLVSMQVKRIYLESDTIAKILFFSLVGVDKDGVLEVV